MNIVALRRVWLASCVIALWGATSASSQSSPRFNYVLGGDIHGVTFYDSTHGWTAEDGGRIRRWDNSASVWTSSTTPDGVRGQMRGVYFRTTSEGWAVGEGGVVLHSTDSGVTWDWINSTTPVIDAKGQLGRLYAVYMSNASDGWVVGEDGVLQSTSDGGVNWSAGTLPQELGSTVHDPHDVYAIHFFDSDHAVAAADYGRLYVTSDAGVDWDAIVLAETPYDPNEVCPDYVSGNLEFWSISFEEPGNVHSPGWVVGGDGTGRGYTFRINDIFASTPSWTLSPHYSGFTTGYPAPTNGNCIPTMYGTCMLGASPNWRPVSTGYAQLILSYEAISGACNCTGTGGTSPSWKIQSVPSGIANPPQWAIARKSSTEAIIVGRNGMIRKFTAPTSGTVATISDQVVYDKYRLRDGVFMGSNVWLALTQGYRVLRSTNGGTSWSQVLASGTINGDNLDGAIAAGGTDSAKVVVVGRANAIAYSSNSGSTFASASVSFSPAIDFTTVEFVPGTNTVFAAGRGGRVTVSTNGGVTWTEVTSPSSADLEGISFVLSSGALRGFVVGKEAGAVPSAVAYRSIDGGQSWAEISIGSMPMPDPGNPDVPRAFYDVATWGSGDEAYAVGTEGAVYKRTSTTFDYISIDLDPGSGTITPREDLFDVELTNASDNVRISGDNGRVLFLDSNTWTSPKSEAGDHLVRASFVAPDHGVMFGQKFLVCEYE